MLRLYRSLLVVVGDDAALMSHWLVTAKHRMGGIPQQQLHHSKQLLRYLVSMRRQLYAQH